MDYLYRFAQVPYSSFKLPELQTLAELEKVDFKLIDYEEKVTKLLIRSKKKKKNPSCAVLILHYLDN